jgi:acyl-CoA synthetase (AMP-forming)/AMP-acid ligase II/thioesterase domain-containing protein/acyl carrier protein
MHQTLCQLLKAQAQAYADAAAIQSPGRTPLTYRGLYRQIEDTVQTLNAMGIGRNDRVAIVLPNGPEMATAFLGVAAGATSAPLNPAYRASEFDFYLSDLEAKALITQQEIDSPAVGVAQEHDIPVIWLAPLADAGAGTFALTGEKATPAARDGWAQPDDTALVLHTSGTTSRPKMVPLSHANLCTSAHNIRTALRLTEADRCLNVMPLFHIHGLMAAILSSLAAGASVVCTPGFQTAGFFAWMDAFRPTWYTAVPTMHQAVLANAATNRATLARSHLRFVRSSSASLPPQVMADLEDVFGAPVIEAYGMTEASHQMTSNPLPPAARKPGSVGVAAGPEVALMDEQGNLLDAEETGEIVIRGPTVTRGYENNPGANQSAFTNGWFRTGDQGRLDDEGYLYITGRLKEIINRGGEKIAPLEIDQVLLSHPAVRQAIAFSVPHRTLGEDVAAAVILRKEETVTEQELREFTRGLLADYKVPSQVLIVDEIPKGPTGKLQRIGLSGKLAAQLQSSYVAPRTSLEKDLARIWADVLRVERVGVHDNLFALGGDSLQVAQIWMRIERLLGEPLPVTTMLEAPTVAQLADILEERALPSSGDCVVALQRSGSRPPLFFVHGHNGQVPLAFGALARHLGADQPFYGLQARGLFGGGEPRPMPLAEIAAHYVAAVREIQPRGPYFLAGWCYGGLVAYEMAQQLRAQDLEIALLAVVQPMRDPPPIVRHLLGGVELVQSARAEVLAREPGERLPYILARLRAKIGNRDLSPGDRPLPGSVRPQDAFQKALERVLSVAGRDYAPQPCPGRLTLIQAAGKARKPTPDSALGWRELATGELDLRQVPGLRYRLALDGPRLQKIAEQLEACMDRALADLEANNDAEIPADGGAGQT